MTQPGQLSSRFIPAYEAALARIITALAAASVTVYDGPQAGAQTSAVDVLFFGVEEPTQGGAQVAIDGGDQEWADLGALHRTEVFRIWSVYVAKSGSTNDFAACRARVLANLALIEASLRTPAGVTLDGALGAPGWCGIGLTRLQMVGDNTGSAVHQQFVIACTARI